MTIKEKLALLKEIRQAVEQSIILWCEAKTQNMIKARYRDESIKFIKAEWNELNKLIEHEETLASMAKHCGYIEATEMHQLRAKKLEDVKSELVEILDALLNEMEKDHGNNTDQ